MLSLAPRGLMALRVRLRSRGALPTHTCLLSTSSSSSPSNHHPASPFPSAEVPWEVDSKEFVSHSFGDMEDKAALDRLGQTYENRVTDALWSGISEETLAQAARALESFVSEQRRAKMQAVLAQRTGNVRMLFECPSNPSNVWAALRTLDSFGIQYADVIFDDLVHSQGGLELGSKLSMSKVEILKRKRTMMTSMGSHKWVTLGRHSSTTDCVADLKKQGYRIVASDLQGPSTSLKDLKICEKTVIVFGKEETGISGAMRSMADERFYIPMRGFAESYNMSASCAITCSYLEASGALTPRLSREERAAVYLTWLMRSVRNGADILRQQGIPELSSIEQMLR